MPLSELNRIATKAKVESTQSKMTSCTSDVPSFMPDHEFVELLWENGQIVMQGQSNRPKKSSYPAPFASHSLRVQEKDCSDPQIHKFGLFEAIDSTVNKLSPTVPCANIGLNAQDEDMAPWINYPMEDPLCSDFFSELAGVSSNPLAAERTAGFAVKGFHSVENGHSSKAPRECLEPSKLRTNQLFKSLQQSQSSILNPKSRLTSSSIGGSGTASAHHGYFQKQDIISTSKPLAPRSGVGLMNFSHFSRPASLARANNESLERLRTGEKVSSSTNPMESTLINSSGLRGSSAFEMHKAEMRSAAKPQVDEATCHEDASRKNLQNNSVLSNKNVMSPDHHINHQSSSLAASVAVGRHEAEKGPEAVVASSVCSGDSAGPASNDLKNRTKRKNLEGDDSGYHSEDLDDESTALKKPAAAQAGAGTKRSRAAQVHNLSERKRRDRINEKMRVLQELIPNCNKVDKASMLDEAIEYLKTLQLQVQMMSMGSGLCMPPMMMPPGMQHFRTPPMAHFSPLGVGLGMGMGLGYGMGMLDINGSPNCPLIPVPAIHTSQFPCSSIPAATGLHGMPGSTGLQLFGIPGHGQRLPVSLSQSPLFNPLSGLAANGGSMHDTSGTLGNPLPVLDVGHSSRCNDQSQQPCINIETTQKTSNSDTQCHLIQIDNQAHHTIGHVASSSIGDAKNTTNR